jgi:hypothetical protein
VTISEPTTLITDYALAVFSAVFGIRLLQIRTQRSTLLWSIGFLTLAGAGLTGGSFHGFRLMMSDSVHRGLWNVTMLLIGVSAGLMISAALRSSFPENGRNAKWLTAGLILSIAGLFIQQGHFSIHPSFNHNDLYHCMQTVALYCFFHGARMMA